jgi:dienelactone hydrolase
MAPFLLQVASQGLVVIANGSPEDPAKGGTYASYGTYGKSSAKSLTDSIDWAVKSSSQPKWAHIDTTRIAAAGQSCGGFEASRIASDNRVTTFGIFNSGLSGTKFTKPTFYFLGGKGDMAASGVSSAPFHCDISADKY